MKYDISELQQLRDFAKQFSQQLQAGDVVFFHGDLGSGKTTLIQLLIKNLGFNGRVKSPTYNLYDSYELANMSVFHMDLYRMTSPEEIFYLGMEEIFTPKNLVLIEWPEKGEGVLPEPDFEIFLEIQSATQRQLKLVK